jgi:hypothetical protein
MDQNTPPESPTEGSLAPVMANVIQYPSDVRTLLSWHAPGRPFVKRSKEYFVNIILIMLAIEVILFLFSQYMLMMVVGSLVFLAYAMATVPPHDFHYKITSEGILVEDHFFLWQELYDFYFLRKEGKDVLHVRTKAYFPGELVIVLGDMSKDHVRSIMLPYLPYREYVKPTFMDRSGDWLEKNFPLDKVPHPHPKHA